MKHLPAAVAAVFLCSCGHADYTLTGTLPDLIPGDSVFLLAADYSELASGIVRPDSTFTIRGRAAEPALAWLADQDRYPIANTYVILEPGVIAVAPTGEFVADITGTPLNDRKAAFLTQWKNSFAKLYDTDNEATARARRAERQELVKQTIDANLDNIFGAELFVEREFDPGNPLASEAHLTQFSARMRQYPPLQRIQQRIDAVVNTEIGQTYTDLSLPSSDGTPIALSSLANGRHWVLLQFWAAWCSDSRSYMARLGEMNEALRNCGVEVYAVSLDNDDARWRGYLSSHNMPWTNVLGVDGQKQSTAAERYGVYSIPANFLIAPDGTIAARNLAPEALLALPESFRR